MDTDQHVFAHVVRDDLIHTLYWLKLGSRGSVNIVQDFFGILCIAIASCARRSCLADSLHLVGAAWFLSLWSLVDY